MKHHVIVKLFRALPNSAIPYWIDFINDKSTIRESVNAEIDRLMSEHGLKFWLAREYRVGIPTPSADELRTGLDRSYRLIMRSDGSVPDGLIQSIRRLPSVEEARAIDVSDVTLPAPRVSTQASLARHRPGDLIYLPHARLISKGRPEITVAVLDTGVDLDHPELQGKLGERADFVNIEGLDTSAFVGDFTGYDEAPVDEVGHGSHVCGIIAGKGLQMDEGVAPECKLMPVRVLATMKDGGRLVGAGIVDNINTGIKWAVDHGADVINMSLGIRHTGGGLPHADVIRYALAKNVAVVAASGNDGTAERYYPGALAGVVAVGAADEEGQVAAFTSYGAAITVIAPGSRIYSSFAHQRYAYASGTSQAAPFVSGAIALMKSFALGRGVKLTHEAIVDVLKSTSDRLDRMPRSVRAGYGLVNLADAFRLLTHQMG